jgi:hypothetical protein
MNIDFGNCTHFRGAHNKTSIFAWNEPQGSVYGVKAAGFGTKRFENESYDFEGDFGRTDNSKKRGIKALPKKFKRLSVRFVN